MKSEFRDIKHAFLVICEEIEEIKKILNKIENNETI